MNLVEQRKVKLILISRYILLLVLSFIIGINNIDAKTISEVNIGDYIKMTPTSTSYTPSPEDTGCLNDEKCTQNTINPSELNLWRVIRKNDDGTVDVVSENVSSEGVYFYGKTGYLNFVGGLNQIAAQYTNKKYVVKTRHMGYSSQTERCTSLDECPEDYDYEIDVNLVRLVKKTLVAKTTAGKEQRYFISSRYNYNKNLSRKYIGYCVRYILESGSINIFCPYDEDNLNNIKLSNYVEASVRPILTLKADIELPVESESGNDNYVLYDLDNPIYNEEKEEIVNKEESINDVKEEQEEIENPNTGNFLVYILVLLFVFLTIVILNISKAKKFFKI